MKSFLKSNIKKLVGLSIHEYKLYHQTKAFEKRYKNVEHSLFENKLNDDIVDKYKRKWESLGYKVETETFMLCYNLSGKIDYNVVPENIFAAIIEPYLNNNKELSFMSIKNIYEKWFDVSNVFPTSYFHKINNVYYDERFKVIEDIQSFLRHENLIYPLICKPSKDTGGGVGVKILYSLEEVNESLDSYENLVYQELIIQNEVIDSISSGINSIRTCLYRTKNGKFKVLNNSIRFGVDGSLDNETAGGIVCNINEHGELNSYAVDKYCKKFIKHPNSNVVFSEVTIPHYQDLFKLAEDISNEIPLCNLISLDMCLDKNNNWRCIEINLSAQTIRFAQYAGTGFFNKYTDEVISKITNMKGV